MNKLLGWMILLSLTGCAVGPDFVQPAHPTQEWRAPLPHGGKVENLTQWWAQFNDPVLNQLIIDAEQTSPSLDMAWAKVQEARANAEGSRGVFLPALGATLASTKSQSVFGQQVVRQTLNRAGFDAGWELDLFGKNRRNAELATANFGASGAQWHAARISLAAEVADAYVELRQCEATADVYQQVSQSRDHTLSMVRQKQSAGLASDVEVARTQISQLDSAAAYAAKQGDCARSINKLTALTGIAPADLQTRLSAQRGQLPVPTSLDVSQVAANALSQRPDVAAAEFNLAAASADIGASKAALLPSLSLLGSIGFNRVQVGGANLQATTWSFGPSLSIPLFDGGKRKSIMEGAKARFDYADASYRRSVREAVREVEDALIRLDVSNTRLISAQQSYAPLLAIHQITAARQAAGIANWLELEGAQRDELQAQEALVVLQRESVSAWIAVYKALGGGWDGKSEPRRMP
ncbi:MAG: efflux transporter outer membrane subunit [Gallionella sp.]|nr:efflux transporter outer membrane subunit [Gallionella sp.]